MDRQTLDHSIYRAEHTSCGKNLVVYVLDLETELHVPVDELRYLGIFITRSGLFKISLDHAKKSFYRSANAIFGKVGRVANEDVVNSCCLVSVCLH